MNPLKTFQNLPISKLFNLILLFIVALFFWTSITCLLPTLPPYIQDRGATAREVGLVMGCFAIGLLLSRVWLGKLADRHGRKLVILIGTLVAAIAPLGYIVFNTIPHFMLVRAFHGISIAAFTTGYSALVVDLSPPKQKGELIGYMSLAISMGMAIGPALGGFLETSFGYQILFMISASCGLCSFMLANQVRENHQSISEQNKADIPKNKENSRSFGQLFISAPFLVPAIIFLLIGCVFGTLVTFLPLYIRDLQVNFNAGLFYTAAAIASFAVRFFAGQVSDRYGRGLLITISIFCYMASMILLSLGNSANIFLLAAIMEGFGAGIIVPITLALISDRCHPQERGLVFAFCTSGFDLGIALGGPLLGGFAAGFGYRFIFAIATGMAISALLVFMIFSNKNLGSSLRFAMGNAPDFYAVTSHKN